MIASVVHAQTTDDFLINLTVGNDVTPPTIPGNFSATPIAPTQIDLDWDASTDDFAVGGYQVFRDTVQIATTTSTSYSDVGLTPSTTYSYYVTAFDTSFNISTGTTPIATTTPDIVVTPTPTSTGSVTEGTRTRDIEILEITHVATEHTIDLSFITNMNTRVSVRWGRTSSYEGGYVASDFFRDEHRTVIDGLESGTVYELEIYLIDQRLMRELRHRLTVRTDSGPDTTAPANPTDFNAVLNFDHVSLSWTNPLDADFAHVRVLSNDRFYPTHPADGWFVYEGDGTNVRDPRMLDEGVRRYYTIFAYDENGNISSGAVTHATRGTYVPTRTEPVDTTEQATSTIATQQPDATFDFDDVQFIQESGERRVFGGEVRLRGSENTTILLPYELVPEHLKAIVMTLTHPDDSSKVFSFLLRINKDKSGYEARIGPLGRSGIYEADVEVFDVMTEELFVSSGTVIVEGSVMREAFGEGGMLVSWESLLRNLWVLFCVILLLLLLVLILFRARSRRREDSAL